MSKKIKEEIKVLLIEDDIFLAKMYDTKLKMENFSMLISSEGEKGLILVKKEQPDIILLDIILPKMDGWEVLKKLKADKKTKDTPVILLTNLGQREDIDKGLALGASDYLIKAHFTPKEVVSKIRDILSK